MFYESKNSLNANAPKFESGTDFNFPPHLHSSFELVTVTEGAMRVTVDRKEYLLEKGDTVLIFPNQVHSLTTEGHSCHFLFIFSPKLVQAYSKIFQSKLPEQASFHPSTFLLDRLKEERVRENPLSLKGILYALCGEFDEGATYVDRENRNEVLLFRIFEFVETNFKGNASLAALSRYTSYHYVYLSKYFRECTGIPYAEYVSRYRVNEACYLLQNSDRTILQTALDCGFDSLRSFNRNFKKILGFTPSAFRERQ